MENQVQQDPLAETLSVPAPGLARWQQDAIIYAVVALAFSCFAVFVNKAAFVRDAGFFAKLFAILVGTGLGGVGALIGNALRTAVQPDAVWTSGGFWSLLWIKVFWRWGPQTIGMCIGVFFGIAMVLK